MLNLWSNMMTKRQMPSNPEMVTGDASAKVDTGPGDLGPPVDPKPPEPEPPRDPKPPEPEPPSAPLAMVVHCRQRGCRTVLGDPEQNEPTVCPVCNNPLQAGDVRVEAVDPV